MKKLLLIIAAMTVMVSCSDSSEKTNADKLADFEKRIEQAATDGDFDKMAQIEKEFDTWFDSLSEEEQEALIKE